MKEKHYHPTQIIFSILVPLICLVLVIVLFVNQKMAQKQTLERLDNIKYTVENTEAFVGYCLECSYKCDK